jgi:hypothetical protein
MAWTAPRTWTTGELVTASIMNAHVKDNLTYLIDRTFCLVMVVPGNPGATTNVSLRAIMPVAGTIVSIKSTCGTAPATTYTYDINKGGTTIYTTQGNRPTRTSGNSTSVVTHTAPDVTTFSAGNVLTIDLDTAGTSIVDAQFYIQFNEDA